jgi:hypothetical protein
MKDYNFQPNVAASTAELLQVFETYRDNAVADLSAKSDDEFFQNMDSEKGRAGIERAT